MEKHPDNEASPKVREVEISKEPTELYKILKFEGLVSSGGEAKATIAGGLVQVNGKMESQKRKKIVNGDVIRFGDAEIRIKLVTNIGAITPGIEGGSEQ